MNKQTIFSGIKSTGRLHIGNYLGAVKNWVELQNSGEYNTIYSIVDLHTITIDISKDELAENTINMAIDLLACGIDPDESILFIQSHVREHTELGWIFNCITPVSELERMTQYKDKAAQHKHNVNVGLFDYPALMAADILLYHATLVPVGDDQDQHVELTRKIAKKFNNRWGEPAPRREANASRGEYFKEPKTLLTKIPRLMSLSNPSSKMGKDQGPDAYLSMSDTESVIRKKISKAVTDTGQAGGEVEGGKNLLNLFEVFSGDQGMIKKFNDDYNNAELKYSELKPALADAIIAVLEPIQQKQAEWKENLDEVKKILTHGADQAREIAQKTMKEVRERIGLV